MCELYEARAARESKAKKSNNKVMQGKWWPTVELEPLLTEAKTRLMIRGAQKGTGGLGAALAHQRKETIVAEERAGVLNAFEDITEEKRYMHCLSMEHFSEWVKWDNVLKSEPRWNEWIMSGEDDLFRFNIAATEDQLPTPSVLKCWKQITDAKCHLCNHPHSSLIHILCGCQEALKQGRQTWRHDSILLALYKQIRAMRNQGAASFRQKVKPKTTQTSFVSSKGNKFSTTATPADLTLFEGSDDWQLQFDVCVKHDGQMKNSPFPPHIAASGQRPDGVMWSDKLKTVIWIELTSPWEENMTRWHFRKHDKYNKLARTVRDNRWTAHPLCVEVGARGFTSNTWHHMVKTLGKKRSTSRKLRSRVRQVAQRCSYYIYLNRKNREWPHPPLIDGYDN